MSAVLSRRTLLALARSVPRTASRRLESTTAATAAAASVKSATKTAGEAAASASQSAQSAVGKAAEKAQSTAEKAAEVVRSTSAADVAAKTSDVTARASERLSRVSAAAVPALARAAKGLGQSLGRFGDPVGKAAGVVERQLPNVIYYARVVAEMSKIVFQAQKMAPPSLETFRTYFRQWYQLVLNAWKSGSVGRMLFKSPQALLQQVQSFTAGIKSARAVAVGVVLAECVGFFSIGEMLGRLKLVGYHGEAPVAHH